MPEFKSDKRHSVRLLLQIECLQVKIKEIRYNEQQEIISTDSVGYGLHPYGIIGFNYYCPWSWYWGGSESIIMEIHFETTRCKKPIFGFFVIESRMMLEFDQ